MTTQAAETHDFDFDLLTFPLAPQEAALGGFARLAVRLLLVVPFSLLAAVLLLLAL